MNLIAPRTSLWRHSLVLVSCTLAITFAPRLAAQGETGEASLSQDLQVASVGYRLARANRDICPETEPLTGLLLHDVSAYDKILRPAIERRFNLGAGLGVRAVIPASAGDRAGLRTGDVIVNIGAQIKERNVEHFGLDLIRERAGSDRTQALSDWLAGLLRSDAQQVTVRRAASLLTLTLASEPGCAGSFQVYNAEPFDAWSDGHNVAINSGALPWLKRADELAFMLAHEMGHNWLEQAYRDRHRPDRQTWLLHIRALPENAETKADLVAIAAMRQAGYQPQAAIDILARLAASDAPPQKARRQQLLKRMTRLEDGAIIENTKPPAGKVASRRSEDDEDGSGSVQQH